MKSTRVVIAVLAAAAAFGLMGCSAAPTSPDLALQPGSGSNIVRETDPPAPIEGQGGDPGLVRAGRFKLIIPRNALKMTAHIVLVQPDPDAMSVEFEITPPEANDFQQPVTLVADCSRDAVNNVANEALYWWDAAGWQAAHPSVADTTVRSLSTHTKHLVACMVGPRGVDKKTHN